MLGILNSIVHSFMYLYYFATAFRPELKKSLWWKKYITQIQLVIILTIYTYSNFIHNVFFIPKYRYNLLYSSFTIYVVHLLMTVNIRNSGFGQWLFKMFLCCQCLEISIGGRTLRKSKNRKLKQQHFKHFLVKL